MYVDGTRCSFPFHCTHHSQAKQHGWGIHKRRVVDGIFSTLLALRRRPVSRCAVCRRARNAAAALGDSSRCGIRRRRTSGSRRGATHRQRSVTVRNYTTGLTRNADVGLTVVCAQTNANAPLLLVLDRKDDPITPLLQQVIAHVHVHRHVTVVFAVTL
jgi:hypothetical protein